MACEGVEARRGDIFYRLFLQCVDQVIHDVCLQNWTLHLRWTERA
jgi:deoxyxylulose-5-phosphate synthase